MNGNPTVSAETHRQAQEFLNDAFGDMAPAGALQNIDATDLFQLALGFGMQTLAPAVGTMLQNPLRLRVENPAKGAGQTGAPSNGQAAGGRLINLHGAQGARRILRVRENTSYLRLMFTSGTVSGLAGGVAGGLGALAAGACLGAGGGWFVPGAVVGGILGGAYGCAVGNAKYVRQVAVTNNLMEICNLSELFDQVPQDTNLIRDRLLELRTATRESTAVDKCAFKEALHVLRVLASPALRADLTTHGIEIL